MKRTLLIIILLNVILATYAQKVLRVSGEYTYYAPENVTLEEAKRTALERAKLDALANVFGTTVTQSNTSYLSNVNDESKVKFWSYGGTEVKGEWIETIGSPEYKISYDQSMLVVKVSVEGKAREIQNMQVDLDVKVLRNGTDAKFESSNFKDGDDLYLYFKSPVDGYLSIYLIDESVAEVYCLLPYHASSGSPVHVRKDKPYVFFSVNDAESTKDEVDEFLITASQSVEYNDLIVAFSKEEYTKPSVDSPDPAQPQTVTLKEFTRWQSSLLTNNSAQVKRFNLVIRK